MTKKPRVRFAPSPTGPLHMGGIRTALYNYLFAKKLGGTFILRIEDTDSQRFVPGAEEYIIKSLEWCGIFPDEGVDTNGMVSTASEKHPHAPYRQSQRKEIYRNYAEELIEKGHAYYAFDTSEELDILRKEAESKKEVFSYNHTNRNKLRNSLSLSKQEVEEIIKSETNWTIRFKTPEDRTIVMNDLIRGEIKVNSNTLDDKVIWKANDQLPTYHLANIIDDHLMEISHVIRGEEWLPSLPLHYLLYESLGWKEVQPEFAHLSLLLKPDGKGKLSKRDGDRLGFPVFPLEWVSAEGEVSRGYREDGYFSEAFINILALLGWNPGDDRELLSLSELIEAFSLERVIHSGAKFNPEKAKWFNQEYLRMKEDNELAQLFLPILKEKCENIPGLEIIEKICSSIKARATFISDFWDLSHYFFIAPTTYNQEVANKFWKEDTKEAVKKAARIIEVTTPFSQETIEANLHAYIKENNLPMGKIMNSLRLAIVGDSKGPSVAEIIEIIGLEEFSNRIKVCPYFE